MDPKTPLTSITGIGPMFAFKLQKLNLFTVDDLINHYPFRYEDFSSIATISQLQVGTVVTLKGQIWSIQNTYTRSRKVLTKATFNDGTGTVELVWFNQSWLTKTLPEGSFVQISGKVNRNGSKVSVVAPTWEKIINPEIKNETLHTGRLVPVYPETYGVTSKWIRQKIANLLPLTLPKISEDLPKEIADNLMPKSIALQEIHFPTDLQKLSKAKYRLSFEELFYIQLATLKKRLEWQKKAILKPLKKVNTDLDNFLSKLPFKLTSAQLRVIDEIITDLKKDYPMNRLVQGEVGSGKTVVAAAIIYLNFINNLNSYLMAPTEILAFQHFQTLSKLLEPFGIRLGIYTGSKKQLGENPNLVIGTHALLSEKLKIDNVGLVIIDEQQRFGVAQRGVLRQKGKTPHFLTLTATPIPRTVALTLYGDLDLSVIDQMPTGRKVIKTHFVPNKKRDGAYKFIQEQVKEGRQIYIITPLIEEPARPAGGSETQTSVKAAKVEFEKLKDKIFPTLKVGLLHGKLKSREKEDVINNFKDHKIDILVSTSVVEVGVDIPNATIMVIEGAEKFGLAQLHQLRGRVGRGGHQSYCFLFTESEIPPIVERLKNLENINDGLKLSELDLKIRGSGEIFGTLQSGAWNLKIASLSDLKLIEETKMAALKLITINPSLDKYPLILGKLATSGTVVMPD